MTIASETRNDINAIQRSLQYTLVLAVLGQTASATSAVFVNDRPGYWWVRQIQAGGTYGPPQQVRGCLIPMATTPGTTVRLGLDEGELAVLGPDFASALVKNINPTQAAVVDPNANNPAFVNQSMITTAYGQIVEGTLKVAIRGWLILNSSGVWSQPGASVDTQIDFTGSVPASGSHCLAATALQSDGVTFEVQYSTAKSVTIPLDLDDINEAWALMSDPLTNAPLWGWDIGDGITTLTEANRWLDLRQLVNFLVASGGGSGTVTSVALTVPTDVLAVSGSPVTSSGTLAISKANQSANTVAAGPTSGGAAAWAFRALVAADIPSLLASKISDFTTQVNTLIAAAVGVTVQAYSAVLTTIAGLSPSNGNFLKYVGTAWTAANIAASDILSGILALARGGTGADLSATGPGFLKQASLGANITVATIANADLPTVDPAHGGTGIASPTAHDQLIANGSGAMNLLAPGAKGNVEVSNGTDFAMQAAGTDGQGLIYQAAQTNGLYARDILYPPNAIINGGFGLWSRQSITPTALTSYSDDTYSGADQWYVLTQTAAVQNARIAGDTNSDFAAQLKQNQITAQRMGYAQILEGFVTKTYRSRPVRLQAHIRCSGTSQVIRYAIVEWTGTEDGPTSDVVNDWTNSTFTAGQFFISTTTTITATDHITLTANTWTNISLTGTPSASANNLILFIWTEGTAAQNVTLDISQVLFVDGVDPVPWIAPNPAQESIHAQRFLRVFSSANAVSTRVLNGLVSATTNAQCFYQVNVPFRIVPSLIATASDWKISNGGGTANVTAIALDSTSTSESIMINATSSGLTVSQAIALLGNATGDRYLILTAEL